MTRQDESLPPGVQRAAAKLRELEVPAGFEERLDRALRSADGHAPQRPMRRRRPGARARLQRGVLVASASVGGLLAAETWIHTDGPPREALGRVEQMRVLLEEGDYTWLALPLATDRHDGQRASIRVKAPRSVSVAASRAALGAAGGPSCDDRQCVHHFEHSTTTGRGSPLRIGVSKEGRYRIEVEHTSSSSRVRQTFLVHASR